MFCPNCGKADQHTESYCRQCGVFLPELSKVVKRETPAEEHLLANIVFNSMTIVSSFTLAILLYAFMGFRTGTHALVYVTAGFLLAIGGWHIQTLARTLKLKKQWKRRHHPIEAAARETPPAFTPAPAAGLLDQANFAGAIPSVTEDTTTELSEKRTRQTS